jgi:hypothetical protein
MSKEEEGESNTDPALKAPENPEALDDWTKQRIQKPFGSKAKNELAKFPKQKPPIDETRFSNKYKGSVNLGYWE